MGGEVNLPVCRSSSAAAGSKKPALQFENVSQIYAGGIAALSNINLTLCQGEAAALCGHNGSGKTTLLKLAAGLLAPTAGDVRLAGGKLDARGRKEAFRKVGFLFQDSEDQLFCPSVGEDVAFGPKNLGLTGEQVTARVMHALEVMGIVPLANRPIHHLSGGEKKRVALAGLVAMDVPLMLLDEPTAGLDPASAREVVALLRMLNREHGHTMLVATHEIDRVPELAGRVIVLRQGTLFSDGPAADVLTDIPALAKAALEAPIITQYFYWLQQNRGASNKPIPVTLAEAMEP